MTEETKFCHNCGEEIDIKATTCPKCGVLQQDKTMRNGELKNPGLAAVLSFLIVGVGQFYNGQFGKGIIFMVVQIVNFVVMFAKLFLWAPVYIAVFAYCVYDAYHQVQLINSGEVVV